MTDLREQEMQNRIDALSTTAENLKTENQMLKAQVAQLQKMVYGSRTEKTKRLFGDTDAEEINLFNEAEIEAKKNAPEPCIEVPAHQRRKKQKNHLAEILASAPHEEHVITQKYQQSLPLYRQEREWKDIGLPLSRATLGNWVIRTAEDWLMPLKKRLQETLLQQEIVHADETPVQVHKEKNRKNPTKSYMWVFSSGEYETAHKIRVYEYQPGRSGSYAEALLKDFHGVLETDGYTGYQKVSCREHAFCWAHARRYFVDAIPPGLAEEDILSSICKQAIERIDEFFALDKGLAELSADERKAQRLQLEKNKLEAYFAWMEEIQPKVLPKSKLGKAIQYSLSHKDGLQAYLQDGNIALSNNICERAIRNFTIGRKNWLFSDSPKGADASAAAYSILETAKVNEINPYKYFKYLFEQLPNIDFLRHPEKLDDFLPWSDNIQQNCK